MAAAAVTGWYGPLIDLSRAASHVGDFVQLLVLVRHCPSHPIQKFRASNRGAIHRTLIQIGDNTRAYFCLSIANNHLGSTMHAGDVVLLQNVKLARYFEVFEAVATQISSVQVLIHSSQLVSMIGVDELIACCKVGINTREKLKKVVEWAHKTESLLRSIKQVPYHNEKQSTKNWKSQEENKSRNCTSVSEVLRLTESCKINFLACIGEIILQSQRPHEVVKNKLLLGKRLLRKADSRIVEDIICTGCIRCGCPINSRLLDGMEFPLYCQSSADYHHSVSFIYQPLLLYVWDHSNHITLLVSNKAAEMLFGNITAVDVYKCFEVVKLDALRKQEPRPNDGGPLYSEIPNGTESTNGSQQLECRKVAKHTDYTKKLDSYSIWLLLLKLLLHNENSPFKFEVSVNLETDKDSGRFELVSLTMPHFVADGG